MSTRPSPPLRPLIVGLGYSGLQVHLPLLDRLRDNGDDRIAGLFSAEPPVAHDSDPDALDYADEDLEVVESLSRASELLYPGNTVVHVCTPLRQRVAVLPELVERGYRLILLDDPLAADTDSLHQILSLSARYRLRVGVLAPWLSSGITRRLLAAVNDGRFGRVRRIVVRQYLPRLSRTLEDPDPGTALDVELPRSLALALALAGNGEVVQASVEPTPMVDGRQVPRMGGAAVTVQHSGGVVTDIVTDLAAPMWDQRVQVEFDSGSVECHYPLGAGDDYAQIFWRPARGNPRREIFEDDSAHQAMLDIYGLFVSESWPEPNLRLHARVVEMLRDAKTLCQRAVNGAVQPTPIAETPHQQALPSRQVHRIQPHQLAPVSARTHVVQQLPAPEPVPVRPLQSVPMHVQAAPPVPMPAVAMQSAQMHAPEMQSAQMYAPAMQSAQMYAPATQMHAPAMQQAPMQAMPMQPQPMQGLGLPPSHPSGPQPSARLAASLSQTTYAFEPDPEPAEPRRYYHR